MSFPRYTACKDSGVEWLGKVPEYWEGLRLRFAATLNPSKQEARSYADDDLVTFLPMEAIGEDGSLNLEQVKEVGECLNGYTYFKEGDVCIAKITPCFENGKGAILRGLKGGIGFGTTELIVARPTTHLLLAKFLDYLFRSNSFRSLGEAAMYGAGGQKRVPEAFVRDFRSFIPPLTEQQQIISFLDRETAKIDALIAEQQRLIELLQEKRQAVICHAVTKGLNPDAPMKDSGVEWLGEVPDHWTVMPLRLTARIESGHTPSRSREDYWVAEECIYPWFTLGDVWQIRDERTEYVFETQEKVSQIGLENSAARLLPANTVILSRTASVGFSGILGIPMATTQDFVNWICGPRICPEYLLFVFRAMAKEFERLKYGSTHNTIYMPDIFSFRTPVPPLDEQRQIVSMVRESLRQLDGSFDDLLKSQELLQERRSALISAAVTGQIDVRGLVPEASAA
jgi:type I restriction enzyme S subunit